MVNTGVSPNIVGQWLTLLFRVQLVPVQSPARRPDILRFIVHFFSSNISRKCRDNILGQTNTVSFHILSN